jgi:hypothetical protein
MTKFTGIVIALLGASLSANAQVDVFVPIGNPQVISITDGPIPGSKKVYVKVLGVPSAHVHVRATLPGAIIYEIAIEPVGGLVQVLLFVEPKPGTSGTTAYLGNVYKVGSNGDLWISDIKVQGTIGSPGSLHTTAIVADSVNIVEATGEIASDVFSLGSASVPGNLARVESTGGSISGHVNANSTIQTVRAAVNIGSATNTVNILSKAGLHNLEGASIWANVDANSTSGTGDIRRIATTTGNFTGTIKGSSLAGPNATDGLSIVGTLNADMLFMGSVLDPIGASSIPLGKTLWITGGLTDDATHDGRITLAASGLVGQVIINSNNAGGTWTGNVTVGPTVLSPKPNYAQLASNIGTGAVGLAPYRLHDQDCTPANGSVITGVLAPGTSVTLRHYGPVAWTTGKPVKVEFKFIGDPTWYDITDDFSVTATTNPREVKVTPTTSLDWDALVQYRITPVLSGANMLKCAGLTVVGTIPVTDYTYLLNTQ